MKRYYYFLACIAVSLSILLSGCTSKTGANCREKFDQYYEINVEKYIETLSLEGEVDTIKARENFACRMEKLFQIDSTFVFMDAAELEKFMNENYSKTADCDSIIPVYKTK